MTQYLFFILIGFIFFEFLIGFVLEKLNSKTWNLPMPKELEDIYPIEKFEKAKSYALETERFSMIQKVISLIISVSFLYAGGYALIDNIARSFTSNFILQSLVFFAIIGLASMLIGLPFEWYETFVIEEKYGFNKMTKTLFITDKLKALLLMTILGGALLAAVSFFYYQLGDKFWWMAWLLVSMFMIFFAMFYTSFLLPIFNQLTPLENGSLRQKIEEYAQKVKFPLTNILLMDGSKRSTKANAFFSGFGKKKSIVLFDTLIKDLTETEITAVLAHEVGHYKKKHILQGMIISLLQTGLLLFIFGWIARQPFMAAVLGAKENSFHLSLITFSMLFSPISMLIGMAMNWLSRKNEYEADNYARETYGAEGLISSLKKLTVNNLGNPQPHPYYVFLNYSHPTLLQRMRALVK